MGTWHRDHVKMQLAGCRRLWWWYVYAAVAGAALGAWAAGTLNKGWVFAWMIVFAAGVTIIHEATHISTARRLGFTAKPYWGPRTRWNPGASFSRREELLPAVGHVKVALSPLFTAPLAGGLLMLPVGVQYMWIGALLAAAGSASDVLYARWVRKRDDTVCAGFRRLFDGLA